jgi:methylated-DNA-[protein]-cysteine S-methyltransferase
MIHCFAPSPIGALLLIGDGESVSALYTPGHSRPTEMGVFDAAAFEHARRELAEYFLGCRRSFDVPLAAVGTPFQQQVWQELRHIDYGSTATYAEIAGHLGRPGAARAVGAANRANPISIIVACHRVIGSNGSLTGYAGGLGAKRWLLQHEIAHAVASAPQPAGSGR